MKRSKQEIFSYIAKTSPKAKEYICYAYQVPKGQVYALSTSSRSEFEISSFFFTQGKQISATVSQAFELAFRKFQDAKEIQKQFLELKQKLEKASPEDKEKIKKEMASLEAKKIAEEDRLQRAREQIKSEAEARTKVEGQAPKKAPPSGPAKAQTTAPAPPPPKQPQPQEKKVEPVSYKLQPLVKLACLYVSSIRYPWFDNVCFLGMNKDA